MKKVRKRRGFLKSAGICSGGKRADCTGQGPPEPPGHCEEPGPRSRSRRGAAGPAWPGSAQLGPGDGPGPRRSPPLRPASPGAVGGCLPAARRAALLHRSSSRRSEHIAGRPNPALLGNGSKNSVRGQAQRHAEPQRVGTGSLRLGWLVLAVGAATIRPWLSPGHHGLSGKLRGFPCAGNACPSQGKRAASPPHYNFVCAHSAGAPPGCERWHHRTKMPGESPVETRSLQKEQESTQQLSTLQRVRVNDLGALRVPCHRLVPRAA
ncbi:bcl-2-binding component 3, isoforms 3/4-like [Anser cygnoides]|uniref:bcl-2-binding component 3, isoforms 3/4-like n=1 Tax=Anser cygnoides TaxID=8845 RepID=UPI0020094F7D|nr:bcl-2-binding component 3, isoforms 3/4-like [Anser cygnoides]